MVQQKWEEGFCRLEEGLFYGDDRVLLLKPTVLNDGTHAVAPQETTTLAALLARDAAGWTPLEPLCRASDGNFQVIAGKGRAKGEGFVVLQQQADGQLRWLIHFYESQAFSYVGIVERQVLAISGGDPHEYRWMIPFDRPEVLRYTIRKPR